MYLNDKTQKTVKADSQGAWSLELPSLANGQYRIRASAPDGNVSSEVVSLTVNNRPPEPVRKPTALKHGYIQGKADPGSIITLFMGDKKLGQAVANAQGAWSYGPLQRGERKPGPYVVSLSIADKSGAIRSMAKQTVML